MTYPDTFGSDSASRGSPLPQLTFPVLLAAFEGWNDAGDAASTAIEHLQLSWDATPLAELDPEFEGKEVLIANTADGRPMADGGLRLVVPGDQRGGRSVHDLVRIVVR